MQSVVAVVAVVVVDSIQGAAGVVIDVGRNAGSGQERAADALGVDAVGIAAAGVAGIVGAGAVCAAALGRR